MGRPVVVVIVSCGVSLLAACGTVAGPPKAPVDATVGDAAVCKALNTYESPVEKSFARSATELRHLAALAAHSSDAGLRSPGHLLEGEARFLRSDALDARGQQAYERIRRTCVSLGLTPSAPPI